MKSKLFALFVVCSLCAFAQRPVARKYSVSTLPSASTVNGQIFLIYDGTYSRDCTVGGATGAAANLVACWSNGTSYSSLNFGVFQYTGSASNIIGFGGNTPTSVAGNIWLAALGNHTQSGIGIYDDSGAGWYGITPELAGLPTGWKSSIGGWFNGMGIQGTDGTTPLFGVVTSTFGSGGTYGPGHNLFNVQGNKIVTTYNNILDDGTGAAYSNSWGFGSEVNVTGATTATVANGLLICNGGSITLPATPAGGESHYIVNVGTGTCAVAGNGFGIGNVTASIPASLTLSAAQAVRIAFDVASTTHAWRILSNQ